MVSRSSSDRQDFVFVPEHSGSADYVDTTYRVYMVDEREALESQGEEVFYSSYESMQARCLYGGLRLVPGSERARRVLEPMMRVGAAFRGLVARDKERLEEVWSRRLRQRLGLEM